MVEIRKWIGPYDYDKEGVMRVGINTLFLIPGKHGGTETYLRNLLLNLARIDRENEYIIFANRENIESYGIKQDNFSKVLCNLSAKNKPLRVIWEQAILPIVARKYKVDVLHAPAYVSPMINSFRFESVVTIHDMMFYYHPENYPKRQLLYFKHLIPLSARKAKRIIAVSNNTKKDIVKILGIPEKKIIVIQETYGEEFRRELNDNAKKKVKAQYKLPDNYILSVASLNPQKNIERLIKAYDILVRSYSSEHKLVLVGMWLKHGSRIIQLIKELQLKERIIFTGYIDNEDLPYFYSLADVFVFPSYFEGFGIPPLEAMACGCPVIASKATSIPEVVGNAAVLINPFSVEELSNAIHRVLIDKNMRDNLIAKGFERVKHFSWEKAARETLHVYKKALKA